MRNDGPETEIVAESSSEPFGGLASLGDRGGSPPQRASRASVPPLHPRVLERYEVGRCLGTGTFGVVYEARERAGGTPVALKKLSITDATAVYAFKQEFRALVDVSHENLVRLDELFSVDDEHYLTMELVLGETFLAHVRPDSAADDTSGDRAASPTADLGTARTLGDELDSAPGSPPSGRRSRPTGAVDPARLRPALRQLARGVIAIHQAKKLHRDIKPSNVICTASGRVVILDFGLVTAPGPRRERRVVGTPAYMSPEQAQGMPLGPASDWYSVGVMLYEALTGDLPFEGDARSIMIGKQAFDAPDPRAGALGVPDDLAELCLGLLERDPRTRLGGAAVLRALDDEGQAQGAGTSPRAMSQPPPSGIEPDAAPLMGRDHHLAALDEAFAASRLSQSVTMLVHGASGMGKSALCRRFLDGLVETQGALVLEGRCYEREQMPYKALDALVDALTDYLAALPRDRADAILPADVPALARLFPVLCRAPAVAAVARVAEDLDPLEARRRAALALRRLLDRVAGTAPLVLFVDDLQWGDADSASLLLDVLAPPDPPRLLLVLGYRSEDAPGVHLAAALLRRMGHGEPVGDVRELWVGPLGLREARALAQALLPRAPLPFAADDQADQAEVIARESGGSPFIVHELARHARAHQGEDVPISLDDVLRRRIDRLPPPSRRLLEVIAVAGQPIGVQVAERAAGVGAAGALSILRAENLVKTRAVADSGGSHAARAVEPFHDRIGEAALLRLTPVELGGYSLALAQALADAGSTDTESLLVYFEAGGDTDRARALAESAAIRAEEALAFDRAAALWRRALEGAPDPQRLRVRLGDTLALAGRGADAGSSYLEAAVTAAPAEKLDLCRRAAEQFLRAGHVEEGLLAVRDVLDAVGLSFPESPTRAFASLLYQRARISLRGLGFTERDAHPPDELTRIDVCWSVGNGLAGVDFVRGADFQARHLRYALQAGEPYRIARALASEGLFASMEGGRANHERGVDLLRRAVEIAERIDHLHAVAWTAGAEAGVAFYQQRFRDAVELSDRALALFRDTRADNVWELGSIVGWFLLPALWFLGRVDEIARCLPAYLKEAEDIGALYNVTSLRTLMLPRVLFAGDRPLEARRESAAALARWSQRSGWTAQHCCDLYTRAHAALYMGDGAGAREEIARSAADLDRSLLLRVECVRVDVTYLRGSAAVAAAPVGPAGAPLLKAAERDARALAREERPYAHAFARALSASVALERGHLDKAAGLYAEAADAFDALEMSLHAAAMRWRQGEVILGEEGGALLDGADRWMKEQGVVRPDRMVAMLAPVRT